jgi:SPP1 family predicted phage head-tail adaptor
MRLGNLDRRINVEEYSEVIDAAGFRVQTWTLHKQMWANFLHKKGSEQDIDKNRTTSRTVEFKTTWHTTITNEMRIFYNGDYYKIEDIKEIQREVGLIIMCTKLQQT